MYRARSRCGPLALTLLALTTGLWAEDITSEPLVTTTWEVRRDAADLVRDLRAGKDIPTLFERVRSMCAEEGDALVAVDAVFSPLADVLAAELVRANLGERYAATYAAPAADALAELLAAQAPSEAWRKLARTYPGTPAALTAWRRLADRSWDLGNLSTYLGVAVRAGDDADATLTKRVDAARSLVSEQPDVRLPGTLDLQEMWRLDLPVAEVAPAPMRRGVRNVPTRATFVLSDTDEDLTAASDGLSCFLFDHLVGRRIGELHSIGRMPLALAATKPASWRGGFVAMGQDRGGVPTLTAIDRSGNRLWRAAVGGDQVSGSVSAPVVIDDVAVVAMLTASEEGPELRVIAHHLSDGGVAWNRFVAKLPLLLGRAMFFDDGNGQNAPLVVRHGGGLLILPSTGLLAKVDALGDIQRIWTYPTMGAGEDRFLQRRENPRPAGLVSDGAYALATPGDADGFAWILGPNDKEPRRYQGDGARSTVVAAANGVAMLVGKQTTLVDCATLKPLWHRTSGAERPAGRIGDKTVLVAGSERLTLLKRSDGTVISDRGAEPPLAFAASDGMVIVAGSGSLVAYGDAAAFVAEQQDAIAKNPSDYRAYVALGKVWAAQGKVAEAYDHLVLGLQHGAPGEYAATAARLLRDQLEGSIDNVNAFASAMDRLSRLVAYAPDLAGEIAFWKARHAEHSGQAKDAVAGYRTVLSGAPGRIELGRGRDAHLEAALSALAQAGLVRLAAAPAPAWLQPLPLAEAPAAPGEWQVDTSRSRAALFSDQLVMAYEGGRLTARRISDGGEAWARTPDLRLLGVRLSSSDAADPGVPIEVLEGTAAAAAGMRNGDLITSFNDRPIRDFHRDLISAVAESGEGSPFTVIVLRGGQRVTLTGRLGGELVEAFATNTRTCLVWPVMPVPGRRGQGEGMWVSALDLTDGRELLRWPLPPVTMERTPPKPLLTSDDVMITVDGVDLVAIDLRAANEQRERWRIPGQGLWLDQATIINAGAALIGDVSHGLFRLLDLNNGEILYTISGDADAKPLFHGTDFFVRTPTAQIACWDLGAGRLRWRSDFTAYRLVAARGDAVFVLDDRKRLHVLDRANGKVRRAYGDWATIDDISILPNRLVLSARRPDGDRVIAALSMPAGAPLWERTLPRGTEIREFHATARGTLVVLAEPTQRASALLLDVAGEVACARYLGDQDVVEPVGDGFIISSTTGLTGIPGRMTIAIPPRLVVRQVSEGESLLATVQSGLTDADWQTVGGGSYAILAVGRSRIIVAKLPPGTETMQVRLGSGAMPIDVPNQHLDFQRHRVARFNDLDDGWRLSSGKKIPAADNVWIFAAQLEPPVSLTPGSALQIRVSAGDAVDGVDVPWWLRKAWRSVIDAQPVSPLSLPGPLPPGQLPPPGQAPVP